MIFSRVKLTTTKPHNITLGLDGRNSANKLILIVGGSGDTRDSLAPLATSLSELNPGYQVATFSFRGVEQKKKVVLRNQVEDLKEVLDFLISDGHKDITILCTSMGAFSTCFALTDNNYKNHISRAIFLDPADYELNAIDAEEQHTLSGADEYTLTSATASSLLPKVPSNVIIDVAHLTIRNYGPDGYAEPENRGHDNPQLNPRLNTQMVKAFYERTPSKNRGQYIEIAGVPHAFVRDSDIEGNVRKLTDVVSKLLTQQKVLHR